MARSARRRSSASDSSSSSSPERELDDDYESVMLHQNDSQSSLSVSLEEMELDTTDYELQRRLSPISRLPAELLIAVFSKLQYPCDLVNCMLVSKAWARNSVDLLWHRPSTTKWKNLLNVIQTARKRDGYFAYHDLIKRINLASLKNEVSDGTLQPLAVCKRIERLTLPGCSQLTDMSLVPVIDGNRSLMAIDLSDLDTITDRTMLTIAKNCYRLQGLNVSNCKSITDESMVEIAKGCRRLKRLKLNECSQLTDYSVVAFADNCHEMLEIDLYKCSHITDMSVTALIKDGKQLRELRLAQCFRITDEAFLQLPAEQHFEALRILDLTDCNELQDAGLQKIVEAAPRLRNLVLAKCRNITDRGVYAVTKLGKNLHFLHLGHCANITDRGVQALVKYCNRIRYIDFSCCAHLTDDSVSMLAALPKLKRIGLVKCVNITDYSIRALARPKTCSSGNGTFQPNNLERLHLSYCTNLTIPGIRALLINCPQLTHLSLTGVTPFLIDDLLHFIRVPPDEFNEHQREVFCVFSGTGVADLRDWLTENYPTPVASDAGSEDEGVDLAVNTPSELPLFHPSPGAQPVIHNAHQLPFGYRPVPTSVLQGAPLQVWRPNFPQRAQDISPQPHLQNTQNLPIPQSSRSNRHTDQPGTASAPPQQLPLPPLSDVRHVPHYHHNPMPLHTPLAFPQQPLPQYVPPCAIGSGRPSPAPPAHSLDPSSSRNLTPGPLSQSPIPPPPPPPPHTQPQTREPPSFRDELAQAWGNRPRLGRDWRLDGGSRRSRAQSEGSSARSSRLGGGFLGRS